MLSSTRRIIHTGWEKFFKSNGFSIATIFILTLVLLLVNALFIFKDMGQFLFVELQEKVDVSVYFVDDALEQDILEVKQTLEEFSEVKEVEYISKKQALENFTEKHKSDIVLMQSLEELGINPLSASLNVRAWEASQYAIVSEFLAQGQFNNLIAKIDYFQKKPVIEKIFSIGADVSRAGIALFIILSVIAALVVFNQVRLTIRNSREEIKVMRLVGASNWFIRGPFVVQGILIGMLASILASAASGLVCYFLAPKLEIIMPGFNLLQYYTNSFLIVLAIQLCAGVGLGVVSSLVAMRKYLRA